MVDINLLAMGNVWKHIGLELVYNPDGNPGVRLAKNEMLKQYFGTMHGGVIAALVDAAMAVAVHNVLGKEQGAATVELKVNFLQAVRDSDLFAFAKVAKKGKQLLTLITEVQDEEDNLIAMGLGTFIVRPLGASEK